MIVIEETQTFWFFWKTLNFELLSLERQSYSCLSVVYKQNSKQKETEKKKPTRLVFLSETRNVWKINLCIHSFGRLLNVVIFLPALEIQEIDSWFHLSFAGKWMRCHLWILSFVAEKMKVRKNLSSKFLQRHSISWACLRHLF